MDGALIAVDIQGFPERTLDKVDRLLGLLAELGRHPVLKGKICLHGGTAINLFMLEALRLSVDIDLSYIGAAAREDMLAERPAIEKAVEEVVAFYGYTSSGGRGEHAGRTFHLKYLGDWGPDQIKIDLIYLNRVPLLAPQLKPCSIRPTLSILTFSDIELIGGKTKALYDRVTVRDIYDIAHIKRYLDEALLNSPELHELYHKVILFHASISNHFPLPFELRAIERFADLGKEMEDQLYPMLRLSERPSLETMVDTAEDFINRFVLPQHDTEREYLERFSRADYCPELLFGEDSLMTAAARLNPEALWKLQNLKRMVEGGL